MKLHNQIYNQLSHKVDYDLNEPINNRAKLDTGTHCNYRCGFCYYKTKLNDVTPIEVIKQRIDYLVACDITEVDLSGGESSIHKEWFEILDYCKDRKLKISCLTNGYKFADWEFIKKSQEHGLEEILFSVHGYDRESHNELVGHRKGWDNIIQAIQNAHELGMLVRINCTVTNRNYQALPTEFVELMQELRPWEINFLTLNYWNDANEISPIDYANITPSIHQAIDKLVTFVPKINVRYTPYCYMVGYEQYVCNYYQHIYDVHDWNIAVYNGTVDPEEYKNDPLKHLYESAKQNRNRTYYKSRDCTGCKHYYICDGVEKTVDKFLFVPQEGDKLTNPNHYRKNFYASISTEK